MILSSCWKTLTSQSLLTTSKSLWYDILRLPPLAVCTAFCCCHPSMVLLLSHMLVLVPSTPNHRRWVLCLSSCQKEGRLAHSCLL